MTYECSPVHRRRVALCSGDLDIIRPLRASSLLVALRSSALPEYMHVLHTVRDDPA